MTNEDIKKLWNQKKQALKYNRIKEIIRINKLLVKKLRG